MSKVITFIIPAYNMEFCLERCLDSFICTSILDQIEVIVINDGSKDGTGQIAERYVQNYPKSFRVIHKKNGGHGSAINVGSRNAQGKYFKVIDADDWVITKNLTEFVTVLESSSADVILTPFDMIDMTTGECVEKRINIKGEKQRFTLSEIMADMQRFESCIVFHGITYRTDFYQKSQYMLLEHVFYEDQEYSAIPFCNAESIEIYPICIYQYMVGNAQQSIAFANQAKRIGHLEKVIKSLTEYYYNSITCTVIGKEYLTYKIEAIVLIYYATACIYEQEKKKGRKLAKIMNDKLAEFLPNIHERTKKKYWMYLTMNRLHVTPDLYQKIIQSQAYHRLKFYYKKR